MHASSRARFKEAYQDIAERLKLPGRDDPQQSVLRLVHRWLSDDENGPWLMVIDSADDSRTLFSGQPADVSGTEKSLASYIPKTGRGSVLVTSRSLDAAERLVGDDATYPVPVMTTNQATQLLHKRLGKTSKKDSEAEASLLAALDYLPLAITQAASYVKRRGATVAAYLEEFRKPAHKAGLLSREATDLRRDVGALNAVVTTWQMTFNQVRHDRPSSAELLCFMSFFNPGGIPKWVLRNYHKSRRHEIVRRIDCDTESAIQDNEAFEDDLSYLGAYSLVEVTHDDMLGMLSLVQFCTQVWLSSFDNAQIWRQKFLQILSVEYPPGHYENWTECRMLDAHIEIVLAEEPKDQKDANDLARLLTNAGLYRGSQGMHNGAVLILRKAIRIREALLGMEHSDTLVSVGFLGLVLGLQGKYQEAEAAHQRTLNGRRKALGEEHPDTLGSLSSLALVLWSRGKYREAETRHRQALDGREKVLGRSHPDTLLSIDNLGSMLRDQGKYKEAETMHRQALNGRAQVLGRSHPDTLLSIDNLGSVLRYQGKYEEAETMHRQALNGRAQVLGRSHPDTLLSIDNLGSVLRYQGKYEEAETMHRQALNGRERVLSRSHPDTLLSIDNLGSMLRDQGKYKEAETMHRQALNGRAQVLGRSHPDTLLSIDNLGSVLRYQGKYEEAETMHRQALDGREKVLGRSHPDTLLSIDNLGSVLRDQGKYEEAETMHRQALNGRERVLSRSHPDTLISVDNLGSVLLDQGKYEETEAAYWQALELSTDSLDSRSPRILYFIDNLAVAIRSQGKLEAARSIVALFLDNATEKKLQDNYLQLALSQAANKGYDNLMKQLLNKVAGIQIRNSEYRHRDTLSSFQEHAKMTSVLTTSHQGSMSFDSEDSNSSIDNDSVFSIPVSLPTATSFRPDKDIIDVLVREFTDLLRQDESLSSLISEAVLKESIGFERIRNNFRKLLKLYAANLKQEALNDQQQHLVRFVSFYAGHITSEVFSSRIFHDRKSWHDILAAKNLHAVNEHRPAVEEYLHRQDHIDAANDPNEEVPATTDSRQGLSVEPDEDSDQDSVVEFGDEEHYDGPFEHLNHMGRFATESDAYETFCRQLQEFVHPSLGSKLRDLVTAWSSPEHKYHAHVTHYKLANLIAELQYIHPSKIQIGLCQRPQYDLQKLLSQCQSIVEHWTGEHWDWWPLPECARLLEDDETRVQWECVSAL